MSFKHRKIIVQDLKELIEEVRIDFSELKGIQVGSGIHEEVDCMAYRAKWNIALPAPILERIDIFASNNLDEFYKRPKEEKKGVIAHELGHNIVHLNKGSTAKLKESWDKEDKGIDAFVDYREIAKHLQFSKGKWSDLDIEELLTDLNDDYHFKFFTENEILADLEAVDRGYGEGLLNLLKYMDGLWATPSEILLKGDPGIKKRIRKIEDKLNEN